MQDALTDQGYWDNVWRFAHHQLEDVGAPQLSDGTTERYLVGELAKRLGPGRRFIEIGAGGSAWPAFVAARLGAEAWGIDFSRGGLALAQKAVAPGTQVHLVEGDLFDPDKLPRHAFDVVYSGGFIEHFPAPRPVMERLAELVTPGGVVITAVPNLSGVNGYVQKAIDRGIWEKHVVLTPSALDAAHATGGLVPVEPARFLGIIDLGAVNFLNVGERMGPFALKGLCYGLSRLRAVGNWLDRRGLAHAGRWWAPMIVGTYRLAERRATPRA